jgi:serine/threonine-protein kinase RsbW
MAAATGPSSTALGVRVELEIAPSPMHLPEIRRAAKGVLAGISAEVADDVLLALDEAVANAIRHGSSAGRPVWVSMVVRDGWIEMAVQDHGPTPWLLRLPADPPAPLALGGRGLWLILQLVDEVRLRRVGEGTLLSLRRRAEANAAATRP